ncbi:triose-phosphate isomerase [Methylobacillus sp. MM3]|jgi:triosephosphate isomerase|uniref:triose-phosphate isomerase n=1 Tax=Methylobacillus sp. MM3 TaxID=1848039 RepID=UPI0007DEAA36|nr:triose-phosphate isomerase [Methylobacillus sp. MM3]OAJ70504.1 triose-phosphate isomerase [Methylobacillus sp. MM3]
MRRKMVVGNWKMNGSIATNKVLLDGLVAGVHGYDNSDYVVCVPYPYLCQAQQLLQDTNVAWGGQNLCSTKNGALTGAVAPHMLTDYGCTHVLIGHSERRSQFHETDDTAAARFLAAQQAGITPIFCMGETAEERESDWTDYIVGRQLDSLIRRFGANVLDNAVLAYEPLWAVGTGKPATPEQAQEVHAFIRDRIAKLDYEVAASVRILYGGSVTGANAEQLFEMPDIDGGLIGRASLKAEDFVPICRAAHATATRCLATAKP